MDNLQNRFYDMMTRLRQSRAAASKDDVMITEMVNGVIITRPAKKYQEITESKSDSQVGPQVIDLQDYAKSKAGSVPGINKMKVINDFISANRGY